jgi:predicted phage baseplate assembly protein
VARATADLVEVTPFVRLPLDRATARVCANVARATAGESVAEVLGSSTGRADQGFALRQGPLAFVPAEGADGRASTLEVRVNGVRWREVPSLFGQPPDARVFETVTDAAGRTLVRFGDGAEGAIPPPGQENIRALYRRAPTAPAAVRAGALSTLAARPAGVKSAVNPLPAGKGAAPQGMAALRTAAPRATRTLGRAVSTEDYADIARGFGIAKVRADWIAAGPGRGVLLTLADDDGNGIDPSAALASRLSASFRQIGDPHLPVRLAAARPLRFRVRAAVRLDPDADPATLGLLRAALKARFGPAARDFGGAVTADAVAAALVAASPAVLGATVLALHAGGAPSLQPRLFASLPVASLAAVPLGAELLILDGDPALEAA